MFRLSSLLETVQCRGWHLPVQPCKLVNCSMPQYPHPQNLHDILARTTSQGCQKNKLNNRCENALKIFLKCHACLKELFL